MEMQAYKNSHRLRTIGIAALLACALTIPVSGCSSKTTSSDNETEGTTLPEKHFIATDESMSTVGDGEGAEDYQGVLDDPDGGYYVINDYYNMTSNGSLHILPKFETYQQTTEYSCGPASALMVLHHFGNDDYNELDICKMAQTDEHEGTTAENLAGVFEGLGWDVELHADTEMRIANKKDAETFFVSHIDEGTPVMVDWVDWGGHWQVVIGIDTCENESPEDDVLIVADPYDVTDHYQEGYYTIPLARFFRMWREGSAGDKAAAYEQPYIVASPAK